MLAVFEKACEAARNIEDDWDSDCMALKRAKTDGGIFYTFGNGRIVFIDLKRGLLHIAYTGPTKRRARSTLKPLVDLFLIYGSLIYPSWPPCRFCAANEAALSL